MYECLLQRHLSILSNKSVVSINGNHLSLVLMQKNIHLILRGGICYAVCRIYIISSDDEEKIHKNKCRYSDDKYNI